jgi:hypothetical protein
VPQDSSNYGLKDTAFGKYRGGGSMPLTKTCTQARTTRCKTGNAEYVVT